MRPLGRIGLAGLLLAGAAPEAPALDPRQPVVQYAHDAWQSRSGIPQESIEAILQARDGHLWLGTRSGLVRFDGLQPTLYDRGNTPELLENRVVSLFEEPSGVLWAGTDGGGLTRLDGGAFRAYTIDEGLSQNYVRAVAATADGSLWVGTGGGGLNRFRDGRFARVAGVPGNVRVLLVDRHGFVWAGTGGSGLVRFDPRSSESVVFTRREGLPDEYVMALAEGGDGDLWVGTRRGLARLRGGRFQAWRERDGLSRESVRCLLEDRDRNLWIGTLGGGLIRMSEGRLERFSSRDGLSDDRVLSLHEDRDGSLWIGTADGLDRLKNSRFATITAREGLSSEDVRTVAAAPDGSVFATTSGGGLNRILGGRVVEVTRAADGLPSDYLNTAIVARDGTLWVAAGASVTHVRAGRSRRYGIAEGFSGAAVSALAESRHGLLAADGTLVRVLRGERFEPFWNTTPPPLKHVYAIHPAADGALWLATSAGLAHVVEGRYTVYTRAHGLPHDTVHAIHEDAEGTLWLATRGGLARFRDGRATGFSASDGLCDNVLFQLLPDSRGRLWMNTGRGVCVVDRADIARFEEGALRRLPALLFDRSDGMKTVEYVAVVQPAGCRTGDGRLWFPTTAGVVSIDAERVEPNPTPPSVSIDSLSIDGHTVLERPASVPPGSRRVQVRYTAVSLRAPERTRFRYRLEGYDTEWIEAGARRSAEYTGLPPGSYRFLVLAANEDGVWSEAGPAVALRVLPRFYQTWWFPPLVGLGAAAALYGAHRARLRRREAEIFAVMEERRRIAREMHDTLIQGVVGVSTQLEVVSMLLGSAPEQARSQLDRVRGLVRDSLDEARRALVDLRTDGWAGHNLDNALRRVADSVPAGIRVELQVSREAASVTGRVRAAAARIAQEAAANAARHAQPAVVAIEAEVHDRRLRLVVRDDGRGFEPEAALAGEAHFGLVGMRERAARVGGALALRSEPGRGTEVVLEAPLPPGEPDHPTEG